MPKATSKPLPKTRSKFESLVLSGLRARKAPHEYEPRDRTVEYTKDHSYLPDVVLANGIIIEIKGYFTSADRAKHLLIKRQHPNLDVRFVFQRATNKLSKASKTSYAAWADRNGFKWAEGSVPESWLNE